MTKRNRPLYTWKAYGIKATKSKNGDILFVGPKVFTTKELKDMGREDKVIKPRKRK